MMVLAYQSSLKELHASVSTIRGVGSIQDVERHETTPITTPTRTL